jgi:hypothetical protein
MVPVVDSKNTPLMPCSEKRARKMVESGKATPFWKLGIFSIRLNVEPVARNLQPVAIGIDPGSKRHGLTVMSCAHTLLNIQATAVTWVKDRMEVRHQLRSGRRFRNTPCRKRRWNRARGRLAPSTKARHDLILRICRKLQALYPISLATIEDICAAPKKGAKRWNANFSPLEVGKQYLYGHLRDLFGSLTLYQGPETSQFRQVLGLVKSKDKLAETFSAHCVDSWVLVHQTLGSLKSTPENTRLQCVVPIELHRRQLHWTRFRKGHKRPRYGGTRSLGFKRGSLVVHPKWGLTYVGGHTEKTISLHSVRTGKRLTKTAYPLDCKFRVFSTLRCWATIA